MTAEQFQVFHLPELLPPGHALVLNLWPIIDHFVVSQLSGQAHTIIAQQLLSENEMYVLLALLDAWPSYASYESLLSALSDRTIQQSRSLVHAALAAHQLDQMISPLRTILKRTRRRLHEFHLDIGSRRGYGYQLFRVEVTPRKYQEGDTT